MNTQTIIDIGIDAVTVALKIAAPALLTIMITGLLISILQAATQINEQTLSFIPKVITMTVVLVITGPWILQVIIFFTTSLYNQIPNVTH
jgi:flagellar biosynthetic protein FliQ